MATFYWPFSASGVSAGGVARGMSMAPFASGIAIGDQATPALYYFSGSAFVNPTTGGHPVFASGYPGIAALAPGTSGDVYALGWAGTLWNQPSPTGTATSGVLPSGQTYAGLATLNGTPWVTSAASGQMFSGAAPVSVGAPLGASSYFLVGSGSTLWTVSGSGVAQFNTASSTWSTLASSAAIAQPLCLAAASGAYLAVGGTVPFSLPHGTAAMAINPVNPLMLAAISSGGVVYISSIPASGSNNWTLSTSLSGLPTTATGLCWTPDGTQLFVATGNGLYILDYSLGVLTIGQTMLGVNTTPLVMTDNTDALVTQSSSNNLLPLTKFAGQWTQGTALTGITNAYAIAAAGFTTAVYGYASGVGYATVSANVWNLGAKIPLPFAVRSIVVDASGMIYAAGVTGASGGFAIVSGTTVVASGLYAGNGVAAAINTGRFIVADNASNLLRVIGQTAPGVWSQRGTVAASGVVSLASVFSTIFAGTANNTPLYTIGAPYTLNPIVSGNVGLWTGSEWVTGALGVGVVPSALTYDITANLYVAATNNAWFTMNQSAAIFTSGFTPTYAHQISGTTLGVSAMLVFGGTLFSATSLSGALIVGGTGAQLGISFILGTSQLA